MSLFIPGYDWYVPSDNFSIVTDAQGVKYLNVFFNNYGTSNVSFSPLSGIIPDNLDLDSVSLVYAIEGADLDSASAGISMIQFTDGATNTSSPVAVTGGLATVANGNTNISTISVVTPPTMVANRILNVDVSFTGNSGSILRIYGAFVNFVAA